MVDECMVELNHLHTYSQFFSRTYTGTGLNPTRDFAVLEITLEAPPFENAFPAPCMPVFALSLSEVAS